MHPQRERLHNELHARPSIYFTEPAHLYHYAFLADAQGHADLLVHLSEATGLAFDTEAVQQIVTLDGKVLKWERHTEFSTLTVMVPKGAGVESWAPPPAWLGQVAESQRDALINATLVLVEGDDTWRGSTEAYGFTDPAGSQVGGGDATTWGDFRLDAGGYTRLLLLNHGLNAFRLGRMVRRLLEIETYRMMASLALPLAKELALELQAYELELGELSDRNAEQEDANPRPLLTALSQLSARLERSGTRSRQRFSATEAYARIVFSRIEELREARVDHCPRLGTFLLRRFRPTVHYCAAIHQRQQSLAESAARLNDLLRTRAQVEIEEQNSSILGSLNERASSQLKIQKAVEGLSIIVISYYIFSLFKLGLESLEALGIVIPPHTAAAVLGPLGGLIIGLLAWRIWRVKQH
ncbi:DUF3422 domain-containing protein [Halomonas sp. MCCC 1A17488]|uniref:DUF3422 domain-containing protein n=1 Tax=Billgrantia sulfidoxydans TaxID=2733484 RepID=A0ABX7W9M7_9GAMM|nr:MULTISPECIES: DUF3422 domain-containing protein [Halomonas]MCE8017771.1 DUF3422 domain-containing protein [Halomonas sp. MCCC 1A17488]MCG3241104.1 DUF3422 domain-containing protein [Halomonas sp. MCCC 1A17488]QPP48961.1 DUF3422 domain-containing protein [Halomonas sp. SS10-MC5]QTP56277.1 DUF3422 domain-containing protein [Halomonas sulfidoxydans]